ncbi:hypothetical protein F2Q68_00026230 [Brassica cretica]|uniref:Chromatin-remodeling ATPase INO80 n=1 Tax=Brassica cretica TaxID=69181 RepID=A0A8S9IFV2_BRACR|nr:hypothetical protein F2Q68_00026230 [Brassica cretica]
MPATSTVQTPELFKGTLKEYQMKGLQWLVNCYEQGLNGILADEMGLGKTIQAMAFLAHLAEEKNIWGPFLVVAPASVLNNWSDEISRFCPDLKTLPYWGGLQERTILRKNINPKRMYRRDAGFHILITSYQLLVTDEKYFRRVKWQYMVLDEAQAIKNSTSIRWKTLLSFNCRNRLLLTGTPIQNNMAELWALLHFIMPMLFDSHEQFNEWFSRGIENHAEHGGTLNEHQLNRLHAILKPFMLRRLKKDVVSELTTKTEVTIHCNLSSRQQAFYQAIKNKISLAELSTMPATSTIQTPELFKGTLKEYQMKGLQWLVNCYEQGLNGILADEMGLGKTIQAMAFLAHLAEEKNIWGPFLVVAPASVLNNWSDEISRFCPDLKTLPYWGGLQERIILRKNINPKRMYRRDAGFHILITSYQLLVTDEKYFRRVKWQYMVLDEAQAIKNSTRIENHAEHGGTLNEHQLNRLHAILKPFMLRRLKKDVVSGLTTKTEVTIHCKLSSRQQAFYQAIKNKISLAELQALLSSQLLLPCFLLTFCRAFSYMFKSVAYGDIFVSPMSVVQPALQLTHRVFGSCPPMQSFDPAKLLTDSGKLQTLDILLKRLRAGNHRVLLFAQMTKMLNILEDYMNYRKYKYLRLDGSSTIMDRRDMVRDFQQRSDVFVFLLSTRAGGLGINLTPIPFLFLFITKLHASEQASATGNETVEEKILHRASQKNTVQQLVMTGGHVQGDDVFGTADVVSLLMDDAEAAQLEQKFRELPLQVRDRHKKKQPVKCSRIDAEGDATLEELEDAAAERQDKEHEPSQEPEKTKPSNKKRKAAASTPKPRVPPKAKEEVSDEGDASLQPQRTKRVKRQTKSVNESLEPVFSASVTATNGEFNPSSS